jgi:Ca2+-binding EF-hand superfamily protein
MSDPNEFAATFAIIDVDGDGLISATELQHLMETLGADVRAEFATHAIEVIDADGDGLVSLPELTAFLQRPDTGNESE